MTQIYKGKTMGWEKLPFTYTMGTEYLLQISNLEHNTEIYIGTVAPTPNDVGYSIDHEYGSLKFTLDTVGTEIYVRNTREPYYSVVLMDFKSVQVKNIDEVAE